MRRVALLCAASTAVLVLAGCGGGEPSAEERWAGDVCSAVATWKTEMGTIVSETADAITRPAQARLALESAFDDGKQATEDLVSDLESLTPPDTPEGQQAKQELDAFATSLQSTLDEAQEALSGLSEASSLADVTSSLSGLGADFQATLDSGRKLVTSLESVGGAIKDGFEDAESCDELRGES
jgi:hypothetical protein